MPAAKLIQKHPRPEADTDMVSRAVDGDAAAFNILYARYVKRISSLVGRMLPNQTEAEEVTQEVFLQVFLGLARFERRSSFYTWLQRVAKHVAMHHLRASRRRYKVGTLSEAVETGLARDSWLATANPQQDAEYNALLAETTRVIEALIPSLREVMILGPVNGRTCEQVAGVLGVSPSVIKARLHRARVHTKEAMWRAARPAITW